MLKLIASALVALVFSAGAAFADVAVTNKTSGTVQVQVGNGSKTEIKNGEKAVFNNTGAEVKVTVYSGGDQKATTTAKNNSKLIVENKNGAWTIKPE